jgi:hypothetical protein
VIKVVGDVSNAKAYLTRLQRDELPKVIGRSLTRAASAARTFSSRTLRERINLPKRVIDQGIKTRRSNEIQTLSALGLGRAFFEIRWTGTPFPLRDYAARQTVRKGVTFKVSRAGGRKTYQRQGRKAFIVAKLGGHVFVRVTDGPHARIKKVFGPSVPQFAITKREQQALIAHVTDFYNREVIRNAKFALSKRGIS